MLTESIEVIEKYLESFGRILFEWFSCFVILDLCDFLKTESVWAAPNKFQ